MSTHVVGFRAPDDKWRKMKAVWDACVSAGIDIPEAVAKFFEWTGPNELGVEVAIEKTECCEEWRDGLQIGFEINLKNLPDGVTHLRFYNSW